jgi:hypothetical protein
LGSAVVGVVALLGTLDGVVVPGGIIVDSSGTVPNSTVGVSSGDGTTWGLEEALSARLGTLPTLSTTSAAAGVSTTMGVGKVVPAVALVSTASAVALEALSLFAGMTTFCTIDGLKSLGGDVSGGAATFGVGPAVDSVLITPCMGSVLGPLTWPRSGRLTTGRTSGGGVTIGVLLVLLFFWRGRKSACQYSDRPSEVAARARSSSSP